MARSQVNRKVLQLLIKGQQLVEGSHSVEYLA